VLHDVERGRVLEQPARKDLVPGQLLLRGRPVLNEDLNERALLGRAFPRERPLARGKLQDDVAHPARFARLHHHVLADIVALVEQAKRRHALFQRRAVSAAGHGRRGLGFRLCDAVGNARLLRFGRRLALAPRQQSHRGKGGQEDGGAG